MEELKFKDIYAEAKNILTTIVNFCPKIQVNTIPFTSTKHGYMRSHIFKAWKKDPNQFNLEIFMLKSIADDYLRDPSSVDEEYLQTFFTEEAIEEHINKLSEEELLASLLLEEV